MSRLGVLAARWAQGRVVVATAGIVTPEEARAVVPSPDDTASDNESPVVDVLSEAPIEVQALRKMPRPVVFKRWPPGTASMRDANAAREQELWAAVKTGCPEAESAIVRDNMGIVYKAARKYHGKNKDSCLSLDELVNEGCVGLLRAVRAFEPTNGNGLYVYAFSKVRRAIQDAIGDNGHVIRVPRNNTFGKSGSLSDTVRNRIAEARSLRDFDGPTRATGADEGRPMSETIPSGFPTPEALCLAKENRNVFLALDRLSEKERFILTQTVIEERTLQEVGDELGRSRERVRQIQAGALHELQHRLKQIERPRNKASA